MNKSPRIIEVTDQHLVVRATPGGRHIERVELTPPAARPVVKWAGGKQWLAPAAPILRPQAFAGRYYEPFLGGAAFFLAMKPTLATLSDRNHELIAAYRAIRDDAEGVIRLLRTYPHSKEFYYVIRQRTPRAPRRVAARVLYLNRTCWNGLYRVNQQGRFNTPFGEFKNPTICDSDRLRRAATRLRRTKLRVGDFETIATAAQPGDFVYFDPPYVTGHHHNGFLKYNAPLFSWADQQRLARLAVSLAERGVYVLASNADQQSVVNLYGGFNYYRARRRSLIGGAGSQRGDVVEALLSNYPILGYPSKVI